MLRRIQKGVQVMVKPIISILVVTALIVVFGLVMVTYAPSGKQLAGDPVYDIKMKADKGLAGH